MRNLFLFAAFVMSSAPMAHAELTWNGGMGVRHMIRNLDDGLDTRNAAGQDSSKSTNKRWEFRGALGVLSKGENVDAGFDMRTASSVSSEWVTTTGSVDFTPAISQAFLRYHNAVMGCDMAVTLGRSKTIMLYDNMAQMLFDNDTRWDGLGWSWKHGMFGMNLSQYVLGATQLGLGQQSSTFTYTEATQAGGDTQSHFAVLYSFQPYVEFKIGDDIKSIFALGFHNWSGTGAKSTTGWYSNAIHGGTAGTVGNVNPVIMDNVQQWQILSDTSLPFNLRFVAEYVRNKKVFYGTRNTQTGVSADNDALALSLGWGKPKKAGEFGLSYSFSDKGIASVITTFSNGDIQADNRSHMFEAKYMLADSLSIAGKAQFHKEKAHLGGDGVALTSPNDKRSQSQKRFEFVGSLTL